MLPGWDTTWHWADQNTLVINRKRRGMPATITFLVAMIYLYAYHVLGLGNVPDHLSWREFLVERYSENPIWWLPTLLLLPLIPRMIRYLIAVATGDTVSFQVLTGRIVRNKHLLARFADVVLVQLHQEKSDENMKLTLVLDGNKTIELDEGRPSENLVTLAQELSDLLQAALRRT
ncbi:MAG: hypothetical protein QNK37_01845 [Acidobacteriota bacterium]|nr:hypothetical protein [Acidobacteriota bacterium]